MPSGQSVSRKIAPPLWLRGKWNLYTGIVSAGISCLDKDFLGIIAKIRIFRIAGIYSKDLLPLFGFEICCFLHLLERSFRSCLRHPKIGHGRNLHWCKFARGGSTIATCMPHYKFISQAGNKNGKEQKKNFNKNDENNHNNNNNNTYNTYTSMTTIPLATIMRPTAMAMATSTKTTMTTTISTMTDTIIHKSICTPCLHKGNGPLTHPVTLRQWQGISFDAAGAWNIIKGHVAELLRRFISGMETDWAMLLWKFPEIMRPKNHRLLLSSRNDTTIDFGLQIII